MKKFLVVFLLSCASVFAQSKANDIPVDKLPDQVRQVLDKYIQVLSSADLDTCAKEFVAIAGGSLVNEDGSLRSTIKDFGLKKDFNNLKHYAKPIKITRVNVTEKTDGYGATAIKGKVYKIWIAKDDPAKGLPAPVSILDPENHPSIKSPKVINVGSY